MGKNIFLDSQQYVAKMKRNSYDVSKLVNGTYKEGFLYPVYWKELSFGESLRLDLSAALRTMPMVFPIQTPIMVKFYNFAVPLRTLWKNFEEFRFNNKKFVHPYIATAASSDFWATGNLADHMGIPTTLSRPASTSPVLPSFPFPYHLRNEVPLFYKSTNPNISSSPVFFDSIINQTQTETFSHPSRLFSYPSLSHEMLEHGKFFVPKIYFSNYEEDFSISVSVVVNRNLPDFPEASGKYIYAFHSVTPTYDYLTESYVFDCRNGILVSGRYVSFSGADIDHGLFGYIESLLAFDSTLSDVSILLTETSLTPGLFSDFVVPDRTNLQYALKFSLGDSNLELRDVSNPFLNEEPLSSLPLRAYESIFRSHFQDTIVDPFIIDGEAQYNRYVTNLDDGADYTDYHLFRCNYEADFLTSARPSPQQGLAPLVGITSAGDITLISSAGNDYSVRVTTSDGDIIDGIDLATERGDKDMSVRRTLLDLATSGFSINALRNTNSFQRWLETNYRRSLRYRDQVFSHTGVKLSYKELDMPEFLGGFTIPLDVNTVTQMSSSVEDSPLGQLGANGGAFGRAKHNISYYAEDECIFMTLMCIRPIPVYSQILSRDWLKSSPVDYYNPEFGKIGNQPITYEEVCPIQAYNEGVPLTDVFGYQRPWYWRISAVDEVHGLFRSTMSSFLQQRVFGSTPRLSADFLHINQEKMTDVFVITDEDKSDPFYGQIGIKAYFKSATPRKNVPSIE